jgi:PadR family transcriptional regulator, regulatory protein PadR
MGALKSPSLCVFGDKTTSIRDAIRIDKAHEKAQSSIDSYRRFWMVRTKNDNLQGALDLLVLKALEEGPMHGWGITLHIERVSDEVLRVEEGSLYPALHRMEQERWIAAEWGRSENNRRARFYRLTSSGRKRLGAEREHWRKISNAIALVLEFSKAAV